MSARSVKAAGKSAPLTGRSQRSGAAVSATGDMALVATDDPRWFWVASCAIVAFAAMIMAYRLGEPLKGFHSYNEGFYLLQASKYSAGSVLSPILHPLDPNNPFLYPLVLSLAFRIAGVSVLVGRTVSVLATLSTVALTIAIGRRLYSSRIGLLAGLLAAFSPGMLLVGRNIQTDPLMIALMLAALLAYLYAVETESTRHAVLTGALLALAVYSKLPAIILVPVLAMWQTWRMRGLAWIKLRSTWVTAIAFVVVASPWYIAELIWSPQFAHAQAYLAGTAIAFSLSELWRTAGSEIGWMLSIPLATLTVVSFVYIAIQRRTADKLVISYLVVWAGVLTFYHFHAYYFLPLAPFAAIVTARGITAVPMLKGGRAFAAASLVSALVLLSFSVIMLSAKKYSGVSADQFVTTLERLGYDPANVVLGIDPGVEGQFGPAIEYHARVQGVADVVTLPLTKPIPAGRQLIVIGPTPAGAKLLEPAIITGTAPVVFGIRVFEYPGRVSWFNHMAPEITRIGPWWRFGFDTVQVEASEFSLSEIAQTD